MGMKEYKFLIHSRDLIVKSEREIFRIDNRMSKIEQEVVDLKDLPSPTRKDGIYEFKLPDIGEGVVEGEVVEWMVSVGDSIKEDDPILSVMTDRQLWRYLHQLTELSLRLLESLATYCLLEKSASSSKLMEMETLLLHLQQHKKKS